MANHVSISSEVKNDINLGSFCPHHFFLFHVCNFELSYCMNFYSSPKAFSGLCACCPVCLTITESNRERPSAIEGCAWYLHTTFIQYTARTYTLAHFSKRQAYHSLFVYCLSVLQYFWTLIHKIYFLIQYMSIIYIMYY